MCMLALQLCGTRLQAAVAQEAVTAAASKENQGATKLVNINSATKAELMTLPGFTEAYADKILERRPFYIKTELRKEILPTAVFYDVVDKIDLSIAEKPKPKQGDKVKTKSKKRHKKKPEPVAEAN